MENNKNTRPLMVTIRCTAYNQEPYIRDCLEGFVMQKTNFRFEAIVHDDASTDRTAAIIKEYAEKYPDIIKPIFETENQYSKHDGSLRRKMNEHMHGKYIAECEGDDYWIDPLKLQKQVDFMERHPDFSLCGTNGLILWEDQIHRPSYFNNEIHSKVLSFKEVNSKWYYPTASLFYRNEVLKNFPNWADKIYSSDTTLVLIAANIGKLYFFKDFTCVYRRGYKESLSAVVDVNRLFVLEQHRLLYIKYLEYTGEKYQAELEKIIAHFDNEIAFRTLLSKNIFAAWLKYPLRLFKEKIIRNIFYKCLGKEKTHLLFH